MNFSLSIKDIELLRNFKGALKKYAEKTEGNIDSINIELQRVTEWIEERVLYWRLEVERATERVEQAMEDLNRCESENDSEDNYRDCSYEEDALSEAKWELDEYQENLESAEQWRFTLETAIDEYYKNMSCFYDLATVHSCDAQTFLADKIEKYVLVHSGNTNISLSDYSKISQQNWHKTSLSEETKFRIVNSVLNLSPTEIKNKADEIRSKIPNDIVNTITDLELVAINSLTFMEYINVNPSLRGQLSDRTLSDKNVLFAEVISSGLKKLPNYTGLIRRNVNYTPEILARHKVGQVVTYESFTHCFRNKPFAPERNTLLTIFSKHGKLIENISRSPTENEVIFDKGTSFLVISKGFDEQQRYNLIELIEIEI